MAEPEAAPQALAISLMGPFFIGWSVNQILWGVLLALFTSYVGGELYQRDSKLVKAGLWITFLLSTVDAGISMQENFDYGTTQNRSIDNFFLGTVTTSLQPLITGLTSMTVQTILTVRAGKLIQRKWVQYSFYGVMGLLIVLAVVGSILESTVAFCYLYGKTFALAYDSSTSIWLWTSAIVDIAISVSLWLTLKKHIVGFNVNTDSVLRRLINLALRTAAYTSFIAVIGAITAVAWSQNDLQTVDIPSAMWLPLGPLHTLSFFTTLNSRSSIRFTSGVQGGIISNPQPSFVGTPAIRAQSPSPLGVRVELGPPSSDEGEGNGDLKVPPFRCTLDDTPLHLLMTNTVV